MSELGNIQKSYGKQINIAVANTDGDSLLQSAALPSNCVIITSPVNSDLTDIGSQSLFVTDINGTSIRLTYYIQQGNGLINDSDVLYLNIDKNTIVDNNGLTASIQNLIDNNTIIIQDNKLHVNTQALDMASASTQGILMYDNNSIMKSNSEQIYVETTNLDKANASQYGIVMADNNTIHITDDGILSVNVENLQKTTTDTLGVCKIDNSTLINTDSIVSVNTNNLQKISNTTLGVAKVDGTTLKSNNGVLSVITSGLTSASSSNKGLVKIDTNSLNVTDGVISVKDYSTLANTITEYYDTLNELETKSNTITEQLNSGELTLQDILYSVTCEDTTITDLAKPAYKEEPKNMEIQRVYVVLDIICNCAFTIDVDLSNNESPAVELSQINYNDEFSYQDFEGPLQVYPSTKMKQKRVVLLFNCRNFNSSVKPYQVTTKITITVASANDKSIQKKVLYSIVRYNSYIKENTTIATVNNTVVFTAIPENSTWTKIN